MLMVFYSDLSIGQMLAVFGYLWFMMAPVQEILGIQYAFYAAKAALVRINRLNSLETGAALSTSGKSIFEQKNRRHSRR